MALRTWLPHLRYLLRGVCGYIDTNLERIKEHLPPGDHNKVDAANLACKTLVAALDLVIPPKT